MGRRLRYENMEEDKELNEEEVLKSLDNDYLLEIINNYLPENQKISHEKGMILIPEAKNLILGLKNLKPIKEDFNLGIDFFREAEKDLKRSKRSYLEKDFSDSIYHLQQTAEKIMKAYGLVQGTFTKKDLFDIQHQTPKAFIKMIQEEKIQLYIQSLKQIYPNLNTDINPLKEIIETKDQELALLKTEHINIWLDLAKNIEEALDKVNLDETLRNVLPNLAEAQGKKISYPSFSTMKFSIVFMKMYLIATLTYPHEVYTRYPDREIKPSQYTEDLGIVKAAPQLFIILDEALDFLVKFIEWKHENSKVQGNCIDRGLLLLP